MKETEIASVGENLRLRKVNELGLLGVQNSVSVKQLAVKI